MLSAFNGKGISSIPTSIWYMDSVYLAFLISWHHKLDSLDGDLQHVIIEAIRI